MGKKNYISIGLMSIFFFLLIVAESNNQKINWYPSFSIRHKMPYGSYIINREAKKIFGDKMSDIRSTPFVFFSKYPDAKGTYVFYNDKIIFGKTNLKKLMDWTKKGNNLFISSSNFEEYFKDSLQTEVSYYFGTKFRDSIRLELLHSRLQTHKKIFFDKPVTKYAFSSFDTINSRVLGKYITEKDSIYNFIQLKYGKGKIFLHSFPYAFTNYFMLTKENAAYTAGLLSYINRKQPVYWDANYQNGAITKGIFKYIAANPAFLWAYRLIFLGILIYIIFGGKRKQRPIPIVEPIKNETLVFTKTVADMYLENKEHKRIALLHINHFMDYVRTYLHLDTRKWNRELIEKIAEKSKTSIDDVKNLFRLIDEINNHEAIKPEVVLQLNELIDLIKK